MEAMVDQVVAEVKAPADQITEELEFQEKEIMEEVQLAQLHGWAEAVAVEKILLEEMVQEIIMQVDLSQVLAEMHLIGNL